MSIPDEARPFLGLVTADSFYQDGISGFLRSYDEPTLRYMASRIAANENRLWWMLNCLEVEHGILRPVNDQGQVAHIGPSWWVTDVLPAIKAELERRTRPKRRYSGNSPIARLKQLDLATVAGKFTRLQTAGGQKLKGRCPLHDERTPSFYVYEDSQRWRCFGACATGGDVVNLIHSLRLKEKQKADA